MYAIYFIEEFHYSDGDCREDEELVAVAASKDLAWQTARQWSEQFPEPYNATNYFIVRSMPWLMCITDDNAADTLPNERIAQKASCCRNWEHMTYEQRREAFKYFI